MASSTLRRSTRGRSSKTGSSTLRRSERIAAKNRWKNLDQDLLVRIFQRFDVTEVTSGEAPIGLICSNWRKAARDAVLWKSTLDLTSLRSEFIAIPVRPHVYVRHESDQSLTRALKVALSLSRGQVRTLMFDYYCFPTEDHFLYFARRCPNLRRLVMPSWNKITRAGMHKAIRWWPHLESLTLDTSTLPTPENLMLELFRHCKNIRELKMLGPIDVSLAVYITVCLPNLQVLSLRCTCILKEALDVLLEELPSLERLNIAHCLLVDFPSPSAPLQILERVDGSVLERGSRLREFVTCMSASCVMCQRVRADNGTVRWNQYGDDMWRVDELPSLSI